MVTPSREKEEDRGADTLLSKKSDRMCRSDANTVLVGKLPSALKELAKDDKPARPTSPPKSFKFAGKPGSEAEGYLRAIYDGPEMMSKWQKWGSYLNTDRIPAPKDLATLEFLRKEAAELSRPLQ